MKPSVRHTCHLLRAPWSGVFGTDIESARAYDRHWHATYGIGLMEHGGHRSLSGRGIVDARVGDLITSNPGEVHDGRPLGDTPRRWRMVYLDSAVMESIAAETGGTIADVRLTRPVFQDAALIRSLRGLLHDLECWTATAAGTSLLAPADSDGSAGFARLDGFAGLAGSAASATSAADTRHRQTSAASAASTASIACDASPASPASDTTVTPAAPATSVAPADAALACEEALVRTCGLILHRHSTAMPQPDARADVARVRDRLADDLADSPSLAELARLVSLSRYQLLRRFARVYGMTPFHWQRQVRVERARALIGGGRTLADAAAACGFADQSHMTRAFAAHFGFTPGAWAPRHPARSAPRDDARD